ncbi:MAG: hypothetical protein AB1449_01670 [Chloroflexota bacterium]
MRLRASILWAGVASGVGLVVLLAFFLEQPALIGLRTLLVGLTVLLSAAALVLGLFNLLAVHWDKVSQQARGWPYSALLILSFLVTLVLGLLFGADFPVVAALFNYVQLPVEASLMALLAVSLTVAGFRLISRRRDLLSVLFVVVAFLVLLGTGPWPVGGDSGFYILIGNLRNWIAQVWAAAGARGIVLGVALGAAATGLRVLLAGDRPYGD